MTERDTRLQPAPGETSTAAVVRELSAQIVSGKLPPGKKLDEALIGEYFGVSRTPVRSPSVHPMRSMRLATGWCSGCRRAS